MSFDHKAYQFDWNMFSAELLQVLTHALTTENKAILKAFINANIDYCRNPYSAERLEIDWELQLEVGDLQEIADFALTKFYSPDLDFGIGNDWTEVCHLLPESTQQVLLGNPIANFDPGRQGSYFQTPHDVINSFNLLATSSNSSLARFQELLKSAGEHAKGIYVTF